jgi:eukaryotic-like serine/threonine-protein kinase
MGEIYLAATTGIEGAERPCVVKIIRRDYVQDRSFLARFLDEARVQAQLQHHGVAQILEASTDEGGEPYVVVEYVEGRSLGEVRTRAIQLGMRIGWAEAVSIATSLAEGLAHIHERTDSSGRPLGIVHRDLSPQNVMVGYGGDVKLIDFGTARGQNRRSHTIAGVVFAKPGYVAPEVANGITGDAKVDLYALGIMFWELLAGRRFLQGDTSEHLSAVAKGERVPPAIAQMIGAPLEIDEIVARLVANDLADRYQSARLAASDLVKLLSKAPPLPNGERGVRARISQLLYQLYPSEPARSRAEFGALVKAARWADSEPAPENLEAKDIVARSESPVLAAGENLPGTRYRILRTIGEGAMGVVYEAEHADLSRRVALKVLAAEHATSKKFEAAFRREARAVARLCHPNLVTIHDFGQASDGRLYCAMELLTGETLEQRLARERPFPWREAVAIGIRACRGLEVAHAAGVVHRDLKPANILLPDGSSAGTADRRAGLKILDFGIAKTSGDANDAASDDAGKAGFCIVGTPEYMAPEQASWAGGDARADIYSLGCVIYEMCTGRLPFVERSPASLVQQKRRSAPESMRVRARAMDLPAGLDRAVLKALAPRPADRFQAAADFRQALERLIKAPHRRRATSRAAAFFAIATLGLCASVIFGMRTVGTGAGVLHAATAAPAMAPATRPSEMLTALPSIEIERSVETASAVPAASADRSSAASRVSPKKAVRGDVKVAPAASVVPPAAVHNAARGAERDAEKERALGMHREQAATHPHDASAQQAWAESAAALRDWNEARKAAEAWVLVDAGVEPRLFLARTLVYGGRKTTAASVLDDVIESHPECDEARALLSDLGIDVAGLPSKQRKPSAISKETSASAQDPTVEPIREP